MFLFSNIYFYEFRFNKKIAITRENNKWLFAFVCTFASAMNPFVIMIKRHQWFRFGKYAILCNWTRNIWVASRQCIILWACDCQTLYAKMKKESVLNSATHTPFSHRSQFVIQLERKNHKPYQNPHATQSCIACGPGNDPIRAHRILRYCLRGPILFTGKCGVAHSHGPNISQQSHVHICDHFELYFIWFRLCEWNKQLRI